MLCLSIAGCGAAPEDQSDGRSGGNQTKTANAPPTTHPGTPSFKGRLVRIKVTGREVTPSLGSVDVPLGETIRIEVNSDTADEVHVHGYDRRADVRPGMAAALEFEANIPGSFEVELEDAGLELFELRVR